MFLWPYSELKLRKKWRGYEVEKKLYRRTEQYFQTVAPHREKSKTDASHHFSLEMSKTLLKQHLMTVYIIIYHVTYILSINKLKPDQNQRKSLEEYFIKLAEKLKCYK